MEVFFFTMVVHLWGKFFMGAWRGGRSWVWVTGAFVFLIGIGTAFTGYLSQQNFDSQWIASEGKDGLNSVGIGAFFNVADFGQMFTWHVILLPVAVVALVVWHVLLVRKHGVVPPYAAQRRRGRRLSSERRGGGVSPGGPRAVQPLESEEWKGPYIRYDLVKEFVIALAVITALVVVLAILFSSPDDKPVTIQQWARTDPGGFRRHRGDRARRLERGGDLRPALQPHARRRPEDRPAQPAERGRASTSRSTPPRTSSSIRCAASPATRRSTMR